MVTETIPMKWWTFLKTVAKDGFFVAGWCDGSYKKSCPGATGTSVGWAAFLHNVIIVHPRFWIVAG